MDSKAELFQRRAEGIIAELANYFETRFQQLTRIHPSLESMHADLLWQQMSKVHDIMSEQKMFGPVRIRVGDILASRDEVKRHAVLDRIDQASIINELVPEEESGARRPGQVAVRNMRALYTSVDPSLGPVIELTDIWLWWDIPDAADVFIFNEQKKLIEKLRGEEISHAVQVHYHDAMGRRDDAPLRREEILSHEFGYLESIWRSFMQRRAEEQSYMKVIKRDPVGGGDSVDDLIVALSQHIAARRKLSEEGGLDDRLREYYSKVLKLAAPKVTPEKAVAHEDVAILRMRGDLKMGLERGEVLGDPYDYKKAQGEQMARDIQTYRKTLSLVEEIVGAVKGAAAAKPVEREHLIRPEPAPAAAAAADEQETVADEGPILF